MNITKTVASQAKEKLMALLLHAMGFAGVGLTTEGSDYVVKVLFTQDPAPNVVPATVDVNGTPVKVQVSVVGPIVPLDDTAEEAQQ